MDPNFLVDENNVHLLPYYQNKEHDVKIHKNGLRYHNYFLHLFLQYSLYSPSTREQTPKVRIINICQDVHGHSYDDPMEDSKEVATFLDTGK